MIPELRFSAIVGLLLGTFALAGCGRGSGANMASEVTSSPSSRAAISLTADEKMAVHGGIAQYTEPTYYEFGVGLHAIANGSSLIISLRNKTGRTIEVLPRDFVLLTSSRREDIVILTPAEAQIFASDSEIEDGGKAFLRADLKRVPNASGMRLVYYNPRDHVQFFVVVE